MQNPHPSICRPCRPVLSGIRLFVFVLALLAWFFRGEAFAQGEMVTLKQRIVQYRSTIFTPTNWAPPDLSYDAEAHRLSQRTDGSWADIQYVDSSLLGPWDAWKHLMRVEIMAAAARNPASPSYNSPQMLAAAVLGLNYWLTRNPQPMDDEWMLAIGRCMSLSTITLLLETELSEAQKTSALGQMYRGIIGPDANGKYAYRFGSNAATGQNLLWIAGVHAHGALLKNSPTELSQALTTIKGLAVSVTTEGLNPDYSFLQHGLQLNTGAYGKAFMWDSARWVYWLRGLSYAYSDTQLAVLRNYVLDGWQWVFRRGTWDPMVLGRQIARETYRNLATAQEHRVLQEMQTSDPLFASSYAAFISHLQGTNDSALVGNKHFWRADYSVHRRPKYSFHIRSSSVRTVVAETGNKENIQNMYQSQGGTSLLLDGYEYYDVQPVIRWDQFPGVTAPDKNPAPRTALEWSEPGKQSFVGGVSNGTYGVSAKDLNWDGVLGKKSWFCFDDDIVALGAGISYTGNRLVRTSLNQALKRPDVFVEYGTGAGAVASGTTATPSTLVNPKWVYHDNVGYYFPASATVELRNQTGATGTWRSINENSYTAADTVTKNVFGLSISHGVNPTAGTYAYTLIPGQTKAFVQSYAAAPQTRIISNTSTLQAVRNDLKKVAGAVFWAPGQVTLTSQLKVSTNQACILLVDESASPMKVSVSRYTSANPVTITLDFTSSPDQVLTFNLPTGGNVGRSVTQNVTVAPPPGVTLSPIADTYVRDGTYATINYGTEQVLYVKNDASSYRREAFLKFDLSTLPLPITSVKLRAPAISGDSVTIAVHRVSSDTWTETGLIWNNRPTTGLTSLGTFPGVAGQTGELDITNAVNAELAQTSGDKILSLRFSAVQTPLVISFGARENTTLNLRTVLQVTSGTP